MIVLCSLIVASLHPLSPCAVHERERVESPRSPLSDAPGTWPMARSRCVTRPALATAQSRTATRPALVMCEPVDDPTAESLEAERGAAPMTATDYLGFIGYIVGFVAIFYIAAALIEAAPALLSADRSP